jgi:diadenosine hexaphosphate hydrolase (ATP-forming)
VYRPDDQRCLLVRSTDQKHWVFPKGHIEAGETPEAAAVREVSEEAGVGAEVVSRLGTMAYATSKEEVRVAIFLMHLVTEGSPHEPRELGWFTWDEAERRLDFEEAKALLRLARAEVAGEGRGR